MTNAVILSQLRKKAATWLSDTGTVEQERQVEGDMGERVTVWQTIASDVKCRVIMAGQGTQSAIDQMGAQETLEETYKISMAAGTPVGVDCKVTVNGEEYSVVRVETALTDHFFVQVIATRRR